MFYIGGRGVIEAEPVGKFGGFIKIRSAMGEFFVTPEKAKAQLVDQLTEDQDSAEAIRNLVAEIRAKEQPR